MSGGWSRHARARRATVLGIILILVSSVLPAQARVQTTQNTRTGAQAPSSFKPEVRTSLRNATSAPLRDIAARLAEAAPSAKGEPQAKPKVVGSRKLDKAKGASGGTGSGLRAGRLSGVTAGSMPDFDVNFEGLGNDAGVLPPDTNGDVGPDHYLQYINLQFGIWDKDGNVVVGSTPGNAFWDGLGGPCETHNDGDPIAQYDHLADRWMVSQFALYASDGFHQCIAVSTSGDPTDTWYQYDFLYSETVLNDYPHFGVWPDGYYMTVNQFDGDTLAWRGAGVMAFDREAMLDGLEAQAVQFDLFGVNENFGGMLPSDLDGAAPPAGAPNIFAEADDDAFGAFATDRLSLWEFHVDWDNPLNSTFGIDGEPNVVLDTDPFEMELCGFARSCIPQPGTGVGLDAISDRLMYRLQYRNFGDHQSIVASHTVDADGDDHAGIRWYELRDSGSGWGIEQQGTYAPDTDHRWMPSAAMDVSGDIAVGYSVSSSSTYPSIRAAGRLVSDPAGELSQGESEMIAGSGSQTHPASRWGDYSAIVLDPIDQCTYWFTTEYLEINTVADWHTRIGHFKFPSCSIGPTGTLTGTVTDAGTDLPIEGATVTAGETSTETDANGVYSFILPVDTYDMSATAYGYDTQTALGVEVLEDQTTTQDFALNAVPAVTVSGTVTDGSGHGWPLYAMIEIDGYPGDPIFTDPETGAYSVELVQQTDFTFHVTAMNGGYLEASRDAFYTSDPATEDFALEVDAEACSALGYDFSVNGLFEDFSDEALPGGWTVVDNAGSGQTWEFDDPAGRGNNTGGVGGFAIVDSDNFGESGYQDTELISPVLDLTTVDTPVLNFNTEYIDWELIDEVADVDLSVDGGSTWENIWRSTETIEGPDLETVAIPQAANDADVQVRFHYYDAFFGYWWEVDNVLVANDGDAPVCDPVPGGLVVGNVYDGNTDEALNGATVTSDDEPGDSATTDATPDDPGLDDGFYTLFSSLTGTHDFTASKSQYTDDTQAVDVAADGVVRQDFTLGAGHLVLDPDSLTVNIDMGDTAQEAVQLNNNGTAPASFELRERDQGFEILRAEGARLTHRTGTFSPYALSRAPKRLINVERPIPPPNAAPWVDIPEYPTSIMDNTAATFDGKVYSVGGFDGGGNVADGFVFDPETGIWTSIASMSFEREKPAAAFIDGLLYVIGGWDNGGTPVDTLEIYDPSTDSWSTGASVPSAWAAATAIALDGQLYVIGGCSDFCGVTDVWVYDPGTDAWSSAAPYPRDVSWTHCANLEGLIYCAGGVSDSEGELDATYVYDPGSDSWSELAPMPQTQWAGGFTGVGGLLLLSGGVTDNFSTVTNEGFAYDPGSDSWSAIPNSNNTVYRGASACGFYKIGGSIGGFSPVPNSELLPDLTDCEASADVTWLSENPTEGTLASGGAAEILVNFDAGVPEVPQPGTYQANITVKEDTPYTVPPLAVTMNVAPPADWGRLRGRVFGLERCDEPGAALSGANVHINGPLADFDIKTGADGRFKWWMPAANDPLSVTVSKAGYVTKSAGGITIDPLDTTIKNFTLRLNAPCAENRPGAINLTLRRGTTRTIDLKLLNLHGAHRYSYSIDETPFSLNKMAPAPARPRPQYSYRAGVGPLSVRSQTAGGGHHPAPNLPPWFGATDIPGGLVRFAHTQCDGNPNIFYVVGGVDGTFDVSKKLWRFNAATTAWKELAPIPEGGEGPTATCEAGQIHVMGGDGTDRHYIYNIANNTWSTGAPLPRPVWGAAAAGFNGLIFLVGGDEDFFSGGTSDEVNVYNIATDSWIGNGAPMPRAAVTPGFFQAGQFLYVVGGWGDDSPDINVRASQRYNLATGHWNRGEPMGEPRADLALAATDGFLYAIGGDADGGGFFDGSQTVERVARANWANSEWAPTDSISIPLTANNGGFCSTATLGPGTEVWSAGGLDSSTFSIQGRMFFRQAANQACSSIRSDVPWLSESRTSGGVPGDDTRTVQITIDASIMRVGSHHATLLISTNDPGHPEMRIPVNVTVNPPA